MKNQINAIVGFSEILQQDVNGQGQKQDHVDCAKEINQIALGVDDLASDILDIFETKSFEARGLSVNLDREIDINGLINRVIRLNYEYGLRKKISIKSRIDPDIFSIKLDLKRTKQALASLISVIVQNSFEGSQILFIIKNFIESDKKYLQIQILCNGFDAAICKLQEDSFIITKYLVELQRGKILIKNNPDSGLKIILEFPY